jgi:mRNA-degrading endonuclease YafQ of YafQ-DinJ toxin-antitoxin module
MQSKLTTIRGWNLECLATDIIILYEAYEHKVLRIKSTGSHGDVFYDDFHLL